MLFGLSNRLHRYTPFFQVCRHDSCLSPPIPRLQFSKTVRSWRLCLRLLSGKSLTNRSPLNNRNAIGAGWTVSCQTRDAHPRGQPIFKDAPLSSHLKIGRVQS